MDLLTYYSDLAVAYPEYITQKQFCEVCGICHKTAYNLTRRGEISYEIVDTPTGRIHHITGIPVDRKEFNLFQCALLRTGAIIGKASGVGSNSLHYQ